MSKRVFLYKENSEDRDSCAYIKAEPSKFECGHYFSRVAIEGACYIGGGFADYENIKTALTEAEYNQLLQFAKDIENLGFGIVEGDERYKKGIALIEGIKPVYNRLLSEENNLLFEEVQAEEIEFLMDEYGLTEDEVTEIFDNYYLEYRDRGVISCTFADAYELGQEEAYSLGIVDMQMEKHGFDYGRYFDYEKFGEDLINDDERYYQLEDERVICLNY